MTAAGAASAGGAGVVVFGNVCLITVGDVQKGYGSLRQTGASESLWRSANGTYTNAWKRSYRGIAIGWGFFRSRNLSRLPRQRNVPKRFEIILKLQTRQALGHGDMQFKMLGAAAL